MKTQLLFCTMLLLGIVGMESLKKEQFHHLWNSISGYSLPVAVVPAKNKEPHCPSNNEINILSKINGSKKLDDTSLTCFMFYNSGKKGFITCKNTGSGTLVNSNVL